MNTFTRVCAFGVIYKTHLTRVGIYRRQKKFFEFVTKTYTESQFKYNTFMTYMYIIMVALMNLTVFVSIDKRNFAHGRDGASAVAETTNYYEMSAAAQA